MLRVAAYHAISGNAISSAGDVKGDGYDNRIVVQRQFPAPPLAQFANNRAVAKMAS